MNNYTLIGRLVKDLEVKESENKKKYGYITVAVNRTYKNAEGNYDTDFIDMIVWNDIAERISEYCHKGDLIAVNGRIETRMITAQDHNEKVTSLVCDKVTFLQAKKNEEESK
ncbi:MAG: single-stranded DNA-binding protein [Bacilli bacterium]|nr:single-stranded DNA-binding protein [bacterium]MBR3890511.1 single-stranded DNA-binding protein [Bacilli bacterium]